MPVITLNNVHFKSRRKAIQKKLRGINIHNAVNVLHRIFGVADCDIRFGGKRMSLQELLELHPWMNSWPANGVAIEFFGGPPGTYRMYNGTVKAYLQDQLNWAITHSDDKKLNQFLAYHLQYTHA